MASMNLNNEINVILWREHIKHNPYFLFDKMFKHSKRHNQGVNVKSSEHKGKISMETK